MNPKVLFLGTRALGMRALSFLLKKESLDVEVAGLRAEDVSIFKDLFPEYGDVRILAGNQDYLASRRYDLIVSVNYDKIVREPLLSSARLGCVNLHHSYNLRIRGRHCATHAILLARDTGVWEHGSTLHYMSSELDAGGVIDSYSCSIYEDDTAYSLFNRCEEEGYYALVENIDRIADHVVETHLPDDNFYVFKKSDLPPKCIDLELPALRVYDLVRSLTFPPFESPYCVVGSKKVNLSINKAFSEFEVLNAGEGRAVYGTY